MKKILLIVLSCLMLTFCVSCGNKEQNGFEKSDALVDYITVYTADGNLEGYMDFEYDDDGKETKYGFKTPDNNWNWYFLYTYDENGNLYHGLKRGHYNDILIKNADGVDIRQGCHHILIENLTGFVEDDCVACTALD